MLIDKIKNLPNTSGVYQYFDKNGKLLYVGKAKNLKNRVKSYFIFTPKLSPNPKNSSRIQKMISECENLEYISTNSEADALILENSFIKQLHPKYNILLRDDKTYPYIYIDLNEEFPRFNITRKIIKKPKIKYYGPFFKGAKNILDALYLFYPLKQKSSCKNLCIFYQIKRCKGICENKISKQEYQDIINQATNALLNPNILIKKLNLTMQNLAINENYEEAAKIRDHINTIKDLQVKIQIDIAKLEDFEIFAIANEDDILSTIRFAIQDGKIISVKNKINILKNKDDFNKNQIYKQFILENFNQEIPLISNQIYIYEEFEDLKILQELLSKRFNKNIKIKIPKIGEKRQICSLAYENALINIKNYKKENKNTILNELKDFFDLQNFPNTIEVFDNSHMQGIANVGAMISYKNNEFDKNSYKKFHLSYKNDYEQMKEVLTRRALSFDSSSPPDLWILDGGKALLDLAKYIVDSVGANIDILAISKEKIDAKAHRAKGKAKDKICSLKGEFKLDINDKKLQFIQKLRDEAHRFAISFHQKTKRKNDLQSSKLLNLGISKANIQKLLNYFGNFENIYNSDFEELKKLTNEKIAKTIKSNQYKF